MTHPAEAAVALVRIDSEQADKVVPLLVKDLKAADEKQKQAAVLALARLGPAAKQAAPALVDSLRDRQMTPPAILALPAIGEAVVPSLSNLLKDPQNEYRHGPGVVSSIRSWARAALTSLIAAPRTQTRQVRVGAAKVVQAIGPDAQPAVPALIANLRSSRPEVAPKAAAALGHIGPGQGSVATRCWPRFSIPMNSSAMPPPCR